MLTGDSNENLLQNFGSTFAASYHTSFAGEILIFAALWLQLASASGSTEKKPGAARGDGQALLVF